MSDLSHLGGWIDDPKGVAASMEKLPYPVFSDIWSSIKGSGKGKKMLLHEIVKNVAGYFPIRKQEDSDCQNPTDMVRMSDGSEKMIKDIEIGEYVLTPYGNSKKVIDRIVKPYKGSMVKIEVEGYNRSISSTPDHLYMVFENFGRGKRGDKNKFSWKPIVSINEGDFILLPKIINDNTSVYKYDLYDFYANSIVETDDFKALRTSSVPEGKIRAKYSDRLVNRHIELDERLSWLIGIYSAEGGVSKSTITFNLNKKETFFAEKIKKYIFDIFGCKASINSVPSKPNCLFVTVSNYHISGLFKYLCPGNIYSKKLDKSLLITSDKNKLQLLSGWMDGDGYRKMIGVSVSESLIHSYFNIANSLGMCPSIYNRKAYKQSKKSYSLNINDGTALLQKQSIDIKLLSGRKVSQYGRVARVKKVEIVNPDTDYVYCIGVEDDHSFICNGFGIHNCVSMGAAGAVDIIKCVDIHINKEFEMWVAETSTEDIYSGSRNIIGKGRLGNGGGSLGVWAAEYVNKYGALARGKYGSIDLSKYDVNKVRSWARPGFILPGDILNAAKQHPVLTISQVNSWEEVRDLIVNGYAVTIACNQGFSSRRDSEGFARPEGSWAHQQYICAVDDEYKRPGGLVMNSWGVWNSGPKRHNQPDGSYWVDAEELERRVLKTGDCWAISGYEGFKPQKLNTRII